MNRILLSARPLSALAFALAIPPLLYLAPDSSGQRGIAVQPVAPDGSPMAGKIWLLVIGINKYQSWPSLQGSVPDAKEVKATSLNPSGKEGIMQRS